MSRKWTIAGVLAVTALAAFMRFYRLDVLPPGLFGDEALVSIHARAAVQTGRFPVYFVQSDGGFHPGVVYATMLFRWLTGQHPYAVRIAMATIGVLSIPLAYAAFWAIFGLQESGGRARAAALVAAFILAITFPYQLINRVGFEATLTVVGGLLSLGLLAYGLRSGQYRYFALAGAALGLSLYAYYSLRFLPFAILGTFGWVAVRDGRSRLKQHLISLAILAACAVVVFAPLGVFFARNPEVFLARAASVSVHTLAEGPAAVPLKLLNAAARTLASISIDGFGDFIARHNLPYRAVFDPVLSVLFWSGLALCARRPKLTVSAILLPALFFLLLPAIITFNLDTPHYTRMTSAMPILAGLAAVGAVALYDLLARHRPNLAKPALALGLGFSLATTAFDYFVRYANHPDLFDAFQVADWQVINFALAEADQKYVYFSPNILTDPAHASMVFMLKDGPARQFPGPGCLVYRRPWDRPALYIVDALHDKGTFDRIHGLFPQGAEGATVFHNVGPWPIYQLYDVPAQADAASPATTTDATFGVALALVGYDAHLQPAGDGRALSLTMHWRALRSLTADYAIFVHLYAPGGDTALLPPIAQSDGFPCEGKYQTSILQAGEVVVDRRTILIPADAAAGRLPLAVGVYDWTTVDRLPVAGTGDILPDNRLRLLELDNAP